MLSKLFTSRITIILSFLLLAAGLVAGITLIRYPQILFPKAAEQCPSTTGPFSLYCAWDAPTGAVSYDYAITKNPNNPEVVQAESGITETFVEFPAYPDEQYTCLVSAYNNCGSKSQAVSSIFSCTAPTPTPKPGCENCAGGVEKKYPEDIWDVVVDDGIINDCVEACLAFYGPACIQGACAVPGSTDPANCCGCQTAAGASCATLPTPTPPPGCNCSEGSWTCERWDENDPGRFPGCWDTSRNNSAYYCYNCSVPNFQYVCCPPQQTQPTNTPTPAPGTPTPTPPAATGTPTPTSGCIQKNCQDLDYSSLDKTYYDKWSDDMQIYRHYSDSACTQLLSLYIYCITPAATATPTLTPTPTPSPTPVSSTPQQIVSRSAWGARPADPAKMKSNSALNLIVVHHTAQVTNSDQADEVRNIQNDHMDNNGWGDIAYHYLIGPLGTIYEGRDPQYVADSRTNYDPTGHLAICLLGNFDEQQPTSAALASLSYLITLNRMPVRGHRELAATACPGNHLQNWLENYRASVHVQGDISGPEGEPDGVVDAADVSVLMSNWGVPFGFNPAADLNNDGQVDALDASLLIQGWSGK